LQCLAQDEVEELIPVQAEVRTGKPYNEIVLAAKKLGADLIVIATHGYSGLKRALLGSTAERVVRYAPCPVLVVREKEKEFCTL
jgi:nucleotide-binding universal stress UspA family protein